MEEDTKLKLKQLYPLMREINYLPPSIRDSKKSLSMFLVETKRKRINTSNLQSQIYQKKELLFEFTPDLFGENGHLNIDCLSNKDIGKVYKSMVKNVSERLRELYSSKKVTQSYTYTPDQETINISPTLVNHRNDKKMKEKKQTVHSTGLSIRNYTHEIGNGIVELNQAETIGKRFYSLLFDQDKKIRRDDYNERGDIIKVTTYEYEGESILKSKFHAVKLLFTRERDKDSGLLQERNPDGELIKNLRED
jgi:hypothetical protein